jgi:ring-1,2-phenylacetyl-CoA epoxidase subunit PaaE
LTSLATSRENMTPTPKFHRLTIRDLRRETADAVSMTFDLPAAVAPDYAFAPGQYLTLRTSLDGEEVRRSYSICSGPDDGELRIAVKKVDGGAFSSWAIEQLKAGDAIDVMTPAGRFGVAPAPQEARLHVGFAAGSGITPIISIIRGVLAREPHSRFFLFYGNRTAGNILFREALEELKDRFIGRLSLFYVLSQEEQDLSILHGRLDRAKVELLLRAMVPAAAIDHVFICGPLAMSEEIEGACVDLGIARDRIHIERFVSGLGGKPRAKAVIAPEAPPAAIAHWGLGWSAVFATRTTAAAGRTIRFGMILCSMSVADTVTSARQKNPATAVDAASPNFQAQPASRSAVTSSTAG